MREIHGIVRGPGDTGLARPVRSAVVNMLDNSYVEMSTANQDLLALTGASSYDMPASQAKAVWVPTSTKLRWNLLS